MTDVEKVIEEATNDVLPFESWEKLKNESTLAFSAFCTFRDLGPERTIKKAVEINEKDEALRAKRYKVWLHWSTSYRWRERAADYDRYTEQLKQTELRKTIEAQGEVHRKVTGKMLEVVQKKLELMNPAELTQGGVTEWVQTAIKTEREAAGLVTTSGKPEVRQGEFNFSPDFQRL